MALKVGTVAPDFELPGANGKTHRLSDYSGKWVLIYFYPKDNTPGCTKQACGIRDTQPNFKKLNAVVFGVSADSERKHTNFTKKYDLNFTLLSDPTKEMIEKYEAWGKKKFMGREYMGIFRDSYLIDPSGKIAKVYEKVKPAVHAEEVLTDLKKLQ